MTAAETTTPHGGLLDEQGYAVVDGVLDTERDLRPLLDEYERVLGRLADSLRRAGTISRAYADLPFAPRLIQITSEHGSSLSRHFDMSLPQAGIRADTPIHLGPACFRLLTSERLLDLAEEFAGPEILVSPVGHVRIKLPEGTCRERRRPDGEDPVASGQRGDP